MADVIKHKQVQCASYAQSVYILGDSIGLPVKAINVVRFVTGELPSEEGHFSCIVTLTDGKTLMVDVKKIIGGGKPFKLEKEFRKVGNYWQLKDKDNPLEIYRRIQILDRNGLIAAIYNNRGAGYNNSGQYTKAISDATRAIELNPTFAESYTNRGVACRNLGQYDKAVSDHTKAIELNPTFAVAYNNRGVVYLELSQYDKVISDFTKAIELNPKLAEAYFGRGIAYIKLKQFAEAASDYSEVIKLTPEDADAYYRRGTVYAILEETEKAKKDLTKAVKLDPAYKAKVNDVYVAYELDPTRSQTSAAGRPNDLNSIKKELLRLADNNTDNFESIRMGVKLGATGNASEQIMVKMKSSVLLGLPELMEKLGIKKSSSDFERLRRLPYIEFTVDVSSGKYLIDYSLKSRRFKIKSQG